MTKETDPKPSSNLPALRKLLHHELFDAVIPFWMKHGPDPDGGLNTCMRNDGSLVSRDKWLWSQWRAVWIFSELHRRFGSAPGGDPRWLELAQNIFHFCLRHGWDEKVGAWRLALAHDGAVKFGVESIYSDGFAIYGCVALARATGSQQAIDCAVQTADLVLKRLEAPHDTIPHYPYPVPPGARIHGLPMMFSLVMWELGELVNDNRYKAAAKSMSEEIFTHFYRPEFDLIVERISADGGLYPPPLGTAVVPGHVIEDMWFQMHIMLASGNTQRMGEACRLMRRHAEAGWDAEFGGLFLGIDAKGSSDIGWKFADTKLWWPHTEALYGFLLAYEQTGQAWCLNWYDKVHEYSFRHYPDVKTGEWTQLLDRQGQILKQAVALPVKDPFHLPRALIYCLEVLDRLIARQGDDAAK